MIPHCQDVVVIVFLTIISLSYSISTHYIGHAKLSHKGTSIG